MSKRRLAFRNIGETDYFISLCAISEFMPGLAQFVKFMYL